MKFIDLCAGIGGFSLGLEMAGMTCVGQVEIDEWCSKILAKHWPGVPRWGDIRKFDPAGLPATQLICGGYPCRPFSQAGLRRGQADDRHLWPYILPIVAAKRPAWLLFENVAGHVTLGLDCVLSDLEGLGYASQALVIPACAVGAPHRRDRVWILAHAEYTERRAGESAGDVAHREAPEREETAGGVGASSADGGEEALAYAQHGGCERRRQERQGKGQKQLCHVVKMFPTPRASDAQHGGPKQRDSKGYLGLTAVVAMFPTPTANDAKNSTFPPSQAGRDSLIAVLTRDEEYELIAGQLNPEWVEWLMGFPAGWTELEDLVTP